MSADIRQHLEKETLTARKSSTRMIIALVIVVAILVAYFQWLRSQLKVIIDEEALATLVTSEIQRNLPTARDALEKNLKEATPEVIKLIVDRVVDEVIPMIREAGQQLFRDYSKELAGYGVEASARIFEELVKESRDDLAKAKETAEPGFYTPNKIAEGMARLIDLELAKRLTEQPEESLGMKLKESVRALRNIDYRLRELASKKNLERKDQLAKDLITTWWSTLRDTDVDRTVEEQMIGERKMPVTTVDDPSVPGPDTPANEVGDK